MIEHMAIEVMPDGATGPSVEWALNARPSLMQPCSMTGPGYLVVDKPVFDILAAEVLRYRAMRCKDCAWWRASISEAMLARCGKWGHFASGSHGCLSWERRDDDR